MSEANEVDALVMCCANCRYWGDHALDIDYAWHYCENTNMCMIIATAPDENCEGFEYVST